jgi:UDP-2,3-diacylglucosamine hydrolase
MGVVGDVGRKSGHAEALVDNDRPIALIAGGGELPLAIADALRRRGRRVLVVAIEEEADRDFGSHSHIRARIGAVGRIRQALVDNGCSDIMMAGTFRRPRFSDIELDLGAVKLALSAILRLRFGGDDAVVSSVARIVEGEVEHFEHRPLPHGPAYGEDREVVLRMRDGEQLHDHGFTESRSASLLHI